MHTKHHFISFTCVFPIDVIRRVDDRAQARVVYGERRIGSIVFEVFSNLGVTLSRSIPPIDVIVVKRQGKNARERGWYSVSGLFLHVEQQIASLVAFALYFVCSG